MNVVGEMLERIDVVGLVDEDRARLKESDELLAVDVTLGEVRNLLREKASHDRPVVRGELRGALVQQSPEALVVGRQGDLHLGPNLHPERWEGNVHLGEHLAEVDLRVGRVEPMLRPRALVPGIECRQHGVQALVLNLEHRRLLVIVQAGKPLLDVLAQAEQRLAVGAPLVAEPDRGVDGGRRELADLLLDDLAHITPRTSATALLNNWLPRLLAAGRCNGDGRARSCRRSSLGLGFRTRLGRSLRLCLGFCGRAISRDLVQGCCHCTDGRDGASSSKPRRVAILITTEVFHLQWSTLPPGGRSRALDRNLVLLAQKLVDALSCSLRL